MAYRSRFLGGLVLALAMLAQSGAARAHDSIAFFMPHFFNGDNLVAGTGLDDISAFARFRAILNAHILAQQEVELVIDYLKQHKAEILAGRNEIFNQVFGKFYVTDKAKNPFIGQYRQITEQARFGPHPVPFEVIASGTTVRALVQDSTWFPAYIKPGDRIFVGSKGATPGDSPVGEVAIVGSVAPDTITLLTPLLNTYTGAVLYRVNAIVNAPNQAYFENILAGYQTIRDAMLEETTYNDGFLFNFNSYPVGDADFAPFSASMFSQYGVLADRRFREAGASNSNSTDNLIANALAQLLAWWDDNDVLQGNPFYQAAMTVINERGQTNEFYVGQAFDRESIEFFGAFTDGSPKTVFDVGPTQFADGTPKHKWQMILEAFGESTEVASKGLMEIQKSLGYNNGTPIFAEGLDAGNFAKFAEFITTLGGVGVGGPTPPIGGGLEPFNKRGSTTLFQPLVPNL
jgi:hypothetical protein